MLKFLSKTLSKKSFLDMGLVSAGHGINTILGFIFFTAVARGLPLDDFGKYALFISLLLFVSKITDFGTNALFIAKSIARSYENLTDIFYSIKVLLFLITIPISLISLYLLNLFDSHIVIIFLLGLFAYEINLTLYALFQESEKYLTLILLNSVMAIIKLIFAILIFLGIFTPTLINTCAIFALSVYPSLLFYVFLPQKFKRFKISFSQVKTFLKESYPGGVSQLISEGWPAISNTIAKLARGFSDVGIYSLAEKISSIFSLISFSVFTVLLPKNALRKKQKTGYDFKETLLVSLGIILLAVVGIGTAHIIIIPIFGEKFYGSMQIMDIMLLAHAFLAISVFIENYFFVEEKTKYLFTISTGKLIAYIILSVILVPIYGLMGLAVSKLIVSITIVFATFVIINKESNKKMLKEISNL